MCLHQLLILLNDMMAPPSPVLLNTGKAIMSDSGPNLHLISYYMLDDDTSTFALELL